MNLFKLFKHSFFSYLPCIVFFVCAFIYYGFFENYLFFYQEKSTLFVLSGEFLQENIHQPGGLLIWLGKLFSTFYYYSLAGAFILSMFLTLLIISVSKIIHSLSGKRTWILPLIFGVSLFWIQTDYRYLLFNTIGLYLQLFIFYIIIRYKTPLIYRGFIVLAPLWYFVTGGFSWILFLMITFYLVFNKVRNRGILIPSLWCIIIATIYISKEYLFFQPVKTLVTFPYSETATGSQKLLFLLMAGLIPIIPLLCKIRYSLSDKLKLSGNYASLIITAILVFIIIFIGIRKYDTKIRQYFYVEKLFYQNRFDDIIAYNTLNPSNNILTIFLNNIALSETGRLDDLLFHYPQSPDGRTLFLKWEMESEILNRGGYFYYTIGMINEAHRWAFENMVMKGLTPEGLKMLIRTELINGNYDMASKYVPILRKTIFYKNEAKEFEELLFNDRAVNENPDLGKKRQMRVENDFFSITDNPYINIEKILSKDILNRKAFEYKIAFMLLKKDLTGISSALPLFERLGFKELPLHAEEAALALSVSNKGILPDVGNLKIRKSTELRWNQYIGLLKQYGSNIKAAEPTLKKSFGDTFWYYVFYR